jgi:DNA polymerase III delta prime subunit
MREEFLWTEKYRPKTISDCVLPERLKKVFQEFVDDKEIQNLLLHGSSGVGKTTVAEALCDQIDCPNIIINGSEESGIDVLRNEVKRFASTGSLTGNGRKMVILDEADYLHPSSTQPALRRLMEEFSSNCGFIFTCNYPSKIIPALHSRCTVIEFKITQSEQDIIKESFVERVKYILDTEDVSYDKDVVVGLTDKYLPDLRRIINELQKSVTNGVIDTDTLQDYEAVSIDELCDLLKQNQFDEVRQWVVENQEGEPTALLRKIYDSLSDMLEPESVPGAVLIIADYSYKSTLVSDQEINLVACMVELMANCEFR